VDLQEHRFDVLTRSLRGGSSRRTVLRGLIGMGLAFGIARVPGEAAAKRKRDQKRTPSGERETRVHAQGRREAFGCLDKGAACQSGSACCSGICEEGKDGTLQCAAPEGGSCGPCRKRKRGQCVPKPNGTPCDGGACQGGVCGPPTCGTGGACSVFVTSGTIGGDLGGLDGADAICQFLAAANGVPGTFRAWLADDTGSPSTRFVKSPGPYVLLDGTVIASSWADLIDGTILAPIQVDESGNSSVEPEAWTNTKVDGTVDAPGRHCQNWTDGNQSGGAVGLTHSTAPEWTASGTVAACFAGAKLYCFQQG
jgi:hypothetical protein